MKLQFLLTFLFFSSFSYGQEVIVSSIQHDGIERDYRLFIPSSYDGSAPISLVFNFHGFGSNAAEQEFYSDMNRVGEAEGFMICYPNGIENSWNVGWEFGSTADDVGFTEALIDEFSQNYNIDNERVYSCGMSNGGFMSYRLACELNDKIAAIASVTGSMAPALAMNCNPGRPVSVLQFHGTNDGTVPYEGMMDLNIGIDSLFNYWNIKNQCTSDPDTNEVEDINTIDGSTAQKISYTNCEFNTEVVLYKIDMGEHTWPGAFLALGVTNQDVEASEVIWDFFKSKTLSNQTSSNDQISDSDLDIKIYPNPSNGLINLNEGVNIINYMVFDNYGKMVAHNKFNSPSGTIDLRFLTRGSYIIQLNTESGTVAKKIIILEE